MSNFENIIDKINEEDKLKKELAEKELTDFVEDEPKKEPVSEFAMQLRPRLENILNTLVKHEVIEFEEEKRPLLIDDMTEAAERARNPKAILKAIMYALINSENVEEIYGSDSELLKYIQEAISL